MPNKPGIFELYTRSTRHSRKLHLKQQHWKEIVIHRGLKVTDIRTSDNSQRICYGKLETKTTKSGSTFLEMGKRKSYVQDPFSVIKPPKIRFVKSPEFKTPTCASPAAVTLLSPSDSHDMSLFKHD